MNGSRHIIAVEPDIDAEGNVTSVPPEAPHAAIDWGAEEEPVSRRSADERFWLAPILAALALIWSAFFLWARQEDFSGSAAPAAWTGLIAEWAVPILLIGVVLLLARRTGQREARRFGVAARSLAAEAAGLESRLTTVNQELSLAREFVAAQSRDLETLGRLATERLNESATGLQDLIQANGERIDAIAGVSAAALENMEQLRGQLPVIASSAKDVTNFVGSAGRTAQAQLEELHLGLQRLGDAGAASEQQVGALCRSVNAALDAIARQCDALDHSASVRLATLAEQSAAFGSQLEAHEAETLAAVRKRADALVQELDQMGRRLERAEETGLSAMHARLAEFREEGANAATALRENEERALAGWREAIARLHGDVSAALVVLDNAERDAIDTSHNRLAALADEVISIDAALEQRDRSFAEDLARRRMAAEAEQEQALTAIEQRLAALDGEIAARQSEHMQRATAFAEQGEAVAERLAQSERRLAAIAEHGAQTEERIAASLLRLDSGMAESQSALDGTGAQIAALIDTSTRLLELVAASAERSREEVLPGLAQGEERLASLETRLRRLVEAIGDAQRQGEDLSGLLHTSGDALVTRFAEIDGLQAAADHKAATHAARLDQLQETLGQIDEANARLVHKAQGELTAELEHLRDTAATMLAEIAAAGPATVSALARQLAAESASALDRAMQLSVAETAGKLKQAAAHAAGLSGEAAAHMREQFIKIDELATGLEARIADAREQAEERVDHGFAQRAARITDALNSNAIDIAKALSSDVSDTAWTAFLRGDRGIFTRRAVTLLNAAEGRAVADLFGKDPLFREEVSRYIHDFEGMLRPIVSTRDGHVLGVTLLSSDMGKLYVALAQATRRLRA